MNQLYAEASVKRKETAGTMMLRVLLIIGIIAGIISMMFGSFLSILGALIVIAMLYLFPKLKVEYEYIFVDGQIDFDKIIGKSKRKSILKTDLEKTDIVAPLNSQALDSFKNIQCEVKDFTSGNKESKVYVIYIRVENKKVKILFEPTVQMVEMMKQKSPRKVEI